MLRCCAIYAQSPTATIRSDRRDIADAARLLRSAARRLAKVMLREAER